MVVSYRNKFIKVFLSSLLLFVLPLIPFLFLYIYGPNSSIEPILEYVISITKYIFPILIILAYGLYTWSHYLLAKAKGYSGWLTLLALINTIGLAIIFLLPDRRKNENIPSSSSASAMNLKTGSANSKL